MKISLSSAVAIAVLVSSYVYAAPVGNPTEPAFLKGANRGKLSGITTFIFDRELDEDSAAIDESIEYTAKISYNFNDKIEVYGLIGASNDFKLKDDKKFITGKTTDVDLRTALLAGGGATVVLHEAKFADNPLRFGVDAKIQTFEADIDNIVADSVNQTFIDDKVKSTEWQVALGMSYQIGRFVPYAGGKYSDVKIKEEALVGGTAYTNTLNSDNIFGIFVGCDFQFTDNVKLNAEGRFIDETAVSIGGTLMY